MRVVSNASPLISLVRIGSLDLLRHLYGEITISEAVFREVVIEGEGHPGSLEVKEATWIRTGGILNRQLVQALRQELDAGEAETIVLALETSAELMIMDERIGREVAEHLGLRCIGVLGLLVESKGKGLIGQVRPYLDALQDVAGFRMSSRLYSRILFDVGEE